MISQSLFDEVKDTMLARLLGLVRVQGKRRPVRIYELLGPLAVALPRRRSSRQSAATTALTSTHLSERGHPMEEAVQKLLERIAPIEELTDISKNWACTPEQGVMAWKYTAAVENFLQKKFDLAEPVFAEVARKAPHDKACQLMLQEVEKLKGHVSADWDGQMHFLK
eukprot:NODE_2822_length_1084_cov_9.595611_g2692_i0.p1 GENE.NODE_2822_length_1084_cov_9.595611_g2692_i0~~NODE_2822_length_1084_cov_9.595611_g2692_i0.p1  ORF type:complete len:167 (-),score=40.56 NODE_2822_length_1084_cov_9.595611_g2692_i0:62-562(-)